jgi:hypothetical protein
MKSKTIYVKATLILFAPAALLFSSCGIKGPPRPPLETMQNESQINSKAIETQSVSATTQTAPVSSDKTKAKK